MATRFTDFATKTALVTGDYFVGHDAGSTGEFRATAQTTASAFATMIRPTWSSAPTIYNAIDVDVTNSASSSSSQLAKWKIGGAEKFGVTLDGDIRHQAATILSHSGTTTTVGKVGDTAVAFPSGAALDFDTIDPPLTVGGFHAAASGNVGIGTTTPGRTLHVIGEGYDFRISDNAVTTSAATPLIEFYQGESTTLMGYCGFTSATDDNMEIRNSLAGNLEFWTNNTSRLTIDSSGNVGIGVTSPSALLEVKSAANGSTAYNNYEGLLINNGSATLGSGNYGGGINFTRNNSQITKGAAIYPVQGDTGDADQTGLAFLVHDSATNTDPLIEPMRINYDGNVGIGTTAPENLLDVRSATASASVLIGSDAYDNDATLFLKEGISEVSPSGAFVRYEGTGNRLGIGTITIIDTEIEAISIARETGNVGIGTTSPGAPLNVQASGVASGTNDQIRLTSQKVGLVAGNLLGGMEFWSEDNNLVSPGALSAYFRAEADATHTASAYASRLVFGVAPASGAPTEAMRIDSSGNVGIGDTSPAHELDVTGDINATGSYLQADVRIMPYMGVTFSTPAETSIAASGTYYKAAGTTTITNRSTDTFDDNAVSNRLRYTGTATRHMHIVAQCSVELASGSNQDIGVVIYHYDDSGASGAIVAHSESRTTIAGTDIIQIVTQGDVMMDQNDYLEIHVANHTATNNCTLQFGYLFAMGMPN